VFIGSLEEASKREGPIREALQDSCLARKDLTAVKLSKCRDRRVSRASFLVVLLESLDEGVGIVGRVVVDNIGRVL